MSVDHCWNCFQEQENIYFQNTYNTNVVYLKDKIIELWLIYKNDSSRLKLDGTYCFQTSVCSYGVKENNCIYIYSHLNMLHVLSSVMRAGTVLSSGFALCLYKYKKI